MADGKDILAYQGNPNLASGFDGGGNPMLGSQKDHYGEIANIMRDVQQKNYQWNMMQYEQRIKDRDASLQLFAQQDINAPMEATDREVVQADYDNIKNIMLQYRGNPFNSNKGRVAIQEAVAKFKKNATLAKARYNEAAKQRLEIANEVDPEKRADMIKHLEAQLKRPVEELPEPYMKRLDYDIAKVLYNPGEELLTTPRYFKGDNGLAYEETVKGVDPKKIVDYYEPTNVLEGNDKTLPDQIGIWADYMIKDERFNKDKIQAINTALNEINKRNNWAEGNKYYQQPLQIKENEDGTVSVTDNPIDFARKMALYAYGSKQTKTTALSKSAQDAFKTRAQEGQANASANAANALASQRRALTGVMKDKLAAEARLAQLKGDTELTKQTQIRSENIEPAITAYQALERVGSQKGKSVKEYLGGMDIPQPILNSIQQQLGATDNYEVIDIPSSDPVFAKMMATQRIKDGKPVAGGVKANKIFALKPKDGSIDGLKIVGIGKDGVPKIVDYKEAGVELLKFDNNYQAGDKVLQRMSAVRSNMDMLKNGGLTGNENDAEAQQSAGTSSSTDTDADNAEGEYLPEQDYPSGVYEIDGQKLLWDNKTKRLKKQ